MNRGQRRGVFDVDEDRAFEALRLAWGEAYDIGFERQKWVATRRDGGRTGRPRPGTGLRLPGRRAGPLPAGPEARRRHREDLPGASHG
jgi:hypothetical protein